MERGEARLIAFGCPITDARAYERDAEPGIRLASEPDSEVLTYLNATSIFRAYNLFCDQAAALDGLEALALIHQDAEIVDPDFCGKARQALEDPDVAIVGCGGAVDVRSIAWWEGSITWSSYTQRFDEMGGGELPGLSWPEDRPVIRTHRGGRFGRRPGHRHVAVGGGEPALR